MFNEQQQSLCSYILHFTFLYISLPSSANKTWNDQILDFLENVSAWRQIFLSPYFDVIRSNLIPSGEFANIFQVKQIGMIAKELQKNILKWRFVDVAVVFAWAP